MSNRAEGDEQEGDEAERDVGADDVEHGPIASQPISYVRNPYEGARFSIGAMLVTLKTTGDETEGRFALMASSLSSRPRVRW